MKSLGSLSERIMFKLQIVTAGKLTRYKGRKIQLKVLKSRRIVSKQSFGRMQFYTAFVQQL